MLGDDPDPDLALLRTDSQAGGGEPRALPAAGRQTWLGRPRRWIGMLMRTMVPILSVFLLLTAALTFGDLSGTGATPDPAVGTHDGAITGRASVVGGNTIEIHGQRHSSFGD